MSAVSFVPSDVRAALWPAGAPDRTVSCRHCSKRNRVSVADAVFDARRCECGSCGRALFLGLSERFEGLAPSAYAHPLDTRALASFKAIPGAGTLLRLKIAAFDERSARLFCRASCIECGPAQHPELVASLESARRSLDVRDVVSLFIGESPFLHASAFGVREPVIVLQSALVDALDEPALRAVMGHELGHLHADHVTYLSLAETLARGIELTEVGGLVTLPLQLALAKWRRCAELTCDRAALLATRDVGAVLGVLSVVAGGRAATGRRASFNLRAWVDQARALAASESSSVVDGAFAAWHVLGSSHPLVAWRLMHLIEWIESGDYLSILAGDHARRPA